MPKEPACGWPVVPAASCVASKQSFWAVLAFESRKTPPSPWTLRSFARTGPMASGWRIERLLLYDAVL
jgi:hypothetical protein